MLKFNALHAAYHLPHPKQLATAQFVDFCIDKWKHALPLHQWLVRMEGQTVDDNPSSGDSQAQPYPKRWIALVGISTLSFIDFNIVNTILPGIQRELNATVDQLQWMMNSFILTLTVFMVTMGRLGDIHGRRKVL